MDSSGQTPVQRSAGQVWRVFEVHDGPDGRMGVYRATTREDITDGMIAAAARAMQNECGPWFAERPEAGLFDWRVAAHNALMAALGHKRPEESNT